MKFSRARNSRLESDSAELLRAVHDEHSAALFWYTLRLTRDYGAAQDVVQESFLKLWKQQALLEQDPESVRKWLFTVARNLVFDHRRSSRYSQEISVDEFPEKMGNDHTDSLLDAWLISDALMSLTEKHRNAIVSVYYLGHSIAEVALREGSAERNLSR